MWAARVALAIMQPFCPVSTSSTPPLTRNSAPEVLLPPCSVLSSPKVHVQVDDEHRLRFIHDHYVIIHSASRFCPRFYGRRAHFGPLSVKMPSRHGTPLPGESPNKLGGYHGRGSRPIPAGFMTPLVARMSTLGIWLRS